MYPPLLAHKKPRERIPSTLFSFILTILVLVAVPPLTKADYSDRILQTSSGQVIGLTQILPDLRKSPIIFIGEKHSDARHHDIQLRIIRMLRNLGIPVVIGLEMFTAKDQPILDAWAQGSIDKSRLMKAHENNWGDTWELYRSIYSYSRKKNIPLVGLNIPAKITNQVARQGFSSLSPELRSELPLVSCDISEDYLKFIRQALSVHDSTKKGREFENFCETQLIWDTAMAFRVVQYLEHNPEAVMVVITGYNHAWRPGIPEQLSRFSDDIGYRIILPEVPPVQTRRSIDKSIADYLWLLE